MPETDVNQTPGVPDAKEKVNLRTIRLNWQACKSVIAQAARKAQGLEFAKDRDYYMQSNRKPLEALIYDLGHRGRGMDDFPFEMAINVPEPTIIPVSWREDRPNILVKIGFSQLFTQITDQIEKYIDVHPNYASYKKDIADLRGLCRKVGDKQMEMLLGEMVFDNLYEIQYLKGEGVEAYDINYHKR